MGKQKVKRIIRTDKNDKSDNKYDKFVNKFCVFCLDNDLHMRTIYNLSNNILNDDPIELIDGLHKETYDKLISDKDLYNQIKNMLGRLK